MPEAPAATPEAPGSDPAAGEAPPAPEAARPPAEPPPEAPAPEGQVPDVSPEGRASRPDVSLEGGAGSIRPTVDEVPTADRAGATSPAAPSPADANDGGTTDEAEVVLQAASAVATLFRACVAISLGVCLLLAVAKVVGKFDISTIWDDGYMFHRYARNLVAEGRLCWNPGGPATYGLTTPMVLLLTVPLHLVTGENPALSVMLSSTLPGVALMVLLAFLWRGAPGSRGAKALGAVLVFVCFALSATTDHFVSGMDTAFMMAYLAGWLLLLRRMDRAPSVRGAVVLGVLGGLAFWARPDLCAYTVAMPAALAVLPRELERRRAGRVALAACVGSLLAVLLINRLYFGVWLPLPFYAKALGLYGAGMRRAYRGNSTIELASFLISYWPLLVIVGLDIGLGVRRWWRREPADLAAAAATFLLLVYYWLVPLPVMYFSSRFYHPVLPALFYGTWNGLARLEELIAPAARVGRVAVLRLVGSAMATTAVVAVWMVLFPRTVENARDAITVLVWRRVGHFDVLKHSKESGPQKYWHRLDQYAALPDDLVIATTEVGMLSALTPHKKVIDLAGLNEPEFALKPFDPSLLLETLRPDLLYMPHPHYKEMITAIEKHPAFRGYEDFDKAALGAKEFGLAIRKDSKHYAAMKQIAGQKTR